MNESVSSKCLIVDDEVDLTDLIAHYFQKFGISFDTCQSTDKALSLINDNPYITILSDIFIQGKSGLELMKQVRACGNQVPFVFLSGNADKEKVTQAFNLGAIDCLEKPFNIELLKKTIFRSMEIGRRQANLDSSANG